MGEYIASSMDSIEVGQSPLYNLIKMERYDQVEKLIGNGVNPDMDATGPLGGLLKSESPLFLASKKGRTDIVKLLLEHGATPDKGYNVLPFGLFFASPVGSSPCRCRNSR